MTTKTAAPESKIINGVDVTRMTETIRAIKSQPEIADFKFRASNTWVDGGENKIEVGNFYGAGAEQVREKPFTLTADEPPVLLGKDKGANPVEYVLAALSGCMTTTLAYHSAAQGVEIQGIESDYEGDLDLKGFLGIDPEVRKGYKEIRVHFKVKTEADKEKLLALAKNSPVFDIITNPTPVKITIETA